MTLGTPPPTRVGREPQSRVLQPGRVYPPRLGRDALEKVPGRVGRLPEARRWWEESN